MRGSNRQSLLLALVLVIVTTHAQDVGFDFLVLTREWGPTFCATTTCKTEPYNEFNIHGLWPNTNTAPNPANCSGPSLNTRDFPSSLLNAMNCEWISHTGSNEAFWSYEWSKHGTCALPLFMTQQAYFQAAIELNTKYGVASALQAAGLSQTSTSLPSAQVQSALESTWGVKPVLDCQNGNISEVKLCISPTPDLKPFDCPSSVKQSSKNCDSNDSGLPQGAQAPSNCQPYFALSPAPSPGGSKGSPAPGSGGGSASPSPSGSSGGGKNPSPTPSPLSAPESPAPAVPPSAATPVPEAPAAGVPAPAPGAAADRAGPALAALLAGAVLLAAALL
eukprot:scaffold12.g8271.t1